MFGLGIDPKYGGTDGTVRQVAIAIEEIAKAEAEEKMAKQADAWKDYGKAAMVAMMLKTIPQVLGEITRPLSWGQLSKITMISDDKGDVGASKLTDEIIKIMKCSNTVSNTHLTLQTKRDV